MVRNAPEESRLKNTSKLKVSGEDDVEGHGFRLKNAPEESRLKNTSKLKVSGEDDVEGHWMPDAGSSMRLAKARNSDIERDARQHQLANDARQHRLDNDPKRTHQKG
jgi:hypothetical protein